MVLFTCCRFGLGRAVEQGGGEARVIGARPVLGGEAADRRKYPTSMVDDCAVVCLDLNRRVSPGNTGTCYFGRHDVHCYYLPA
jgi:hypothetical protein